MDAEQKKKCSDLLEYFMRLDSAEPFLERVNWEEWGLFDYLQIVKVPMDLGTIRSKLGKSGAYRTSADFVKDMRLVWDNCRLYNQEGSDLHDIAGKLSKRFEDRVRALKLDVGAAPRVVAAADKSAVPTPSMEERIRFGQNLYKVASKDLGEIVTLLEEKCPKALDKSSPDELDIVVDAIETKTFRELEKLVLERIPEASRESTAPTAAKRVASSSGDSDLLAKKTKTIA